MVMSMDVTSDQTMSSSPPVDLSESGTLTQSPSPFQNQASVDGDEHDDEHSKCSGQTIVTMQQQQQQQQQQRQQQQLELASRQDENEAGFSSDQHEQRMVLSGGSSFDEDDKRLLMNVDCEDEGDAGAATMGANLRLEQAELEARLTQAKSTRFGATAGGQRTVESSLVAQMRDIVEGGSSSAAAAVVSSKQSDDNKLDNKENKTSTCEPSGKQQQQQQKSQQKSSSDSLNNQNENGNSRASIDSSGQRRTRHSRAHHCKHHNNDHHHHHHGHQHSQPHHHHHHHHHRHRQSISGGSLPGQVEGADADTRLAHKLAPGSQPHAHHHPHSHHHHHQQHNHGRHRHSNSSHPHHHHHHHHHHHSHDNKRGAPTSANKRNSIQRLSLAMIEPSGLARSAPEESCDKRLETSGQSDQKAAIESNNSSLSSVSSSTAAIKSGQHQHPNNPNQSNLESKSSESPPSDERAGADRDGEVSSSMQRTQTGAHHQSHGHHHHVHHHHCHHRSHKKRLVLDAGNDQPEAVTKSDMQQTRSTTSNIAESSQSCDLATRRRPLQDLASGANASVGGVVDVADQDKAAVRQHHAHHSHHHPHHHHHQQQHLHHRHHHHNVQCAHHQKQQGQDEEGLAAAASLGDGEQSLAMQQTTTGRVGTASNQQQQHHHHCMHRHHRHHHHHHNNNHAHHHHCRHQRSHAAAHRNRQKSVSQTNVDRISTRDSSKTLDRGDEGEIGNEPRLTKEGHSDLTTEGRLVANNDDDVVKMETSSPSLGTERRQSMQKSDKDVQQTVGNVVNSQSDQPNGLEAVKSPNDEQQNAADSDLGGAGESSHKVGACELNQEAQFAETNQENFRSGNGGGGGGDDDSASQQQANKLTRQMSSQSSRMSQKNDGTHDGPDNLDGQNQSEHLRECAKRALQPTTINQRSDETRQVIESSVPSDRRCRLCWCCCCPCSALSVRDASSRVVEKPAKTAQGPPSSPMGSNYPSLPNVPLDEIRSWGESFDKLMKCSDGRKVFQDFLRCEYSEENILFWAACEELKKEKDSKNIASKARDIYEDYISILSSKEVSLDSRVRDIINNNIKKPTSNIFDEAQLQIYTLMHRDSYPRFINSIMYKKLAQIPVSNSRKSSS